MKRVLAVTGLLVAVMQVYRLPEHARNDQFDAAVYSSAARHCAAGEQVYGGHPRTRLDQSPFSFLYPPTALAMICPFGHADETAFRTVYLIALLTAYWLFAAALGLLATGTLSGENTLAAGALAQLTGVGVMVASGNVDVMVLAMIAWAFAAPRAAAPLLVVAAAIKIYPVFLFVAWLPSMRARHVRDGVVAALGVIGLYFLTGADRYLHEWNTAGASSLSELGLSSWNWSLSALPFRPFFSGSETVTPAWVHAFMTAVPLAAVVATLYLSRKWSREARGCAVLLASITFAPICWWWRLAVALTIPAALWIRKRKELSCEAL